MPLMFHDVRMPEDIEVGAVGGPRFATGGHVHFVRR
jgi:hypothetical protein